MCLLLAMIWNTTKTQQQPSKIFIHQTAANLHLMRPFRYVRLCFLKCIERAEVDSCLLLSGGESSGYVTVGTAGLESVQRGASDDAGMKSAARSEAARPVPPPPPSPDPQRPWRRRRAQVATAPARKPAWRSLMHAGSLQLLVRVEPAVGQAPS